MRHFRLNLILLLLLVAVLVEGKQPRFRSNRLFDGLPRRNDNQRHLNRPAFENSKDIEVANPAVDPEKASLSFQVFYAWYLRQCTVKPLVTKSISAGIMNFIGDYLAQNLEAFLAGEFTTKSLDINRLVGFFLCGLLYVGPFVHYWYEFLFRLAKWMEYQYKTPKMWRVIAQVFTDQTLGVAIYFPSYFFVFEYLESLVLGRTPSIARAKTKCLDQINNLLMMQYRVFPFTNAINMAFVPPQLRVLFSNTISIFWNIYLCTLLAK